MRPRRTPGFRVLFANARRLVANHARSRGSAFIGRLLARRLTADVVVGVLAALSFVADLKVKPRFNLSARAAGHDPRPKPPVLRVILRYFEWNSFLPYTGRRFNKWRLAASADSPVAWTKSDKTSVTCPNANRASQKVSATPLWPAFEGLLALFTIGASYRPTVHYANGVYHRFLR